MSRMLIFLPKGYQKKHYSISGIYLQSGDYGCLKSRELDKKTKSYLSVSLGFFVRVRVRFTTNQFLESKYLSLSIRVRFMIAITRLPES